MYTRPYSDEGHGIIIPESYGGTLLKDNDYLNENTSPKEEINDEAKGKNPWEQREDTEEDTVHTSGDSTETFSIFSRLPFAKYIPNSLKNVNFSFQKIGTEEIILIAAAAFLFFTKNGDKECAIMLILLLFLS